MDERIRIFQVMRKTGLTRRTVQNMAARGDIPGAAKLGHLWTFNRRAVERWITQQEQQCQKTSSSETELTMPAFRSTAKISENRFARAIAERQQSG